MLVSLGLPFPLGATVLPDGVNFAVFSANSKALDLCLYDPENPHLEIYRARFPKRTDGVWHIFVAGLKPGALYALRAHGPFEPHHGHRYNPSKLLLDPYARALTGPVLGQAELVGENPDGSRNRIDTANYLPRCIVLEDTFDWANDVPPRKPWDQTIVYETHVRGTTMRHPDVPEELRGTYAGLASEPMLQHLESLGVTTVQLLPVHQHIEDHFLRRAGLSNYWGYQTIGFFAPHEAYAADRSPGGPVREFKKMIKDFHAAGLEVILDVVFNHTGEGGAGGSAINFRGLDNFIYYRVKREDRSQYLDFTGTGNTLDMRHPRVLQMVLDSLRYWVNEMHVDGFRFDLAATLGRESDGFDPQGGFFRAIRQDPVLSTVKLIAEPWDIGWGGYQLGNFPEPFVELNGRFRDDVRRYWRSDAGSLPALASRLTGSEDIFGSGQRPQRCVNFITCHDGFTLRDWTSYNEKHNEANNEGNRDGDTHNLSWNCGVEGPTEDAAINALRARQQRNMLATLFLSQGVPFLLGGDELSRTQGGNNNAYCQDTTISWFDWTKEPESMALRRFIRQLIDLRNQQPVFRKQHFLHGNFLQGGVARDVMWLTPEGRAMTGNDWQHAERRALGMLLTGSARSSMSNWRRSRHGSTFLVLLNAEKLERPFLLPGQPTTQWQPVLDTTLLDPFQKSQHAPCHGHSPYSLSGHAMAVLRLIAGTDHDAQSVLGT